MRRVLKFYSYINEEWNEILMPKGAQIVLVGVMGNLLEKQYCIWAECEGIASYQKPATWARRLFRVYGTGQDIHNDDVQHRGSFIAGPYVGHVYEKARS